MSDRARGTEKFTRLRGTRLRNELHLPGVCWCRQTTSVRSVVLSWAVSSMRHRTCLELLQTLSAGGGEGCSAPRGGSRTWARGWVGCVLWDITLPNGHSLAPSLDRSANSAYDSDPLLRTSRAVCDWTGHCSCLYTPKSRVMSEGVIRKNADSASGEYLVGVVRTDSAGRFSADACTFQVQISVCRPRNDRSIRYDRIRGKRTGRPLPLGARLSAR
ncbi:hypothetical protein FaHV1S18_034 [Falconid herpesvirus 1]|uniref:Uncharacterized protein n=2 Tax=Columbid alphaherpesvirus 1 TaxID=93386 RepID=A0A068EVW9_9ALPH|nr:hypothetical protein FaHV1S18_034 [Falconid herpesvirus 1]YP_009352928.1 hypothetical protein CoHVHLJ_034 [Columbid alphaherpesvirus 1]AID52724.1 hypothetical protein FaHV1S18_034 [Falconid herpesvirus 1]ARD71345.1 hypothetical protein CoHVHLJ_034 [Columbid alphaherpesvirus 1]